MQRKNCVKSKSFFLTLILIMAYSFSLPAKEKSVQENPKKVEKNSKEEMIFDSCENGTSEKCEKDTQVPIPDYSKSLK